MIAPQEEACSSFKIQFHDAGQRLDHFLTQIYPEHSRSFFQKLVDAAHIRVNEQFVKSGYRLRREDIVTVFFPASQPSEIIPERIDFSVIFEDEQLLVINKPPGVVVHPANGNRSGTLVHGLLHRFGNLPAAHVERPGIVHRLDKDTSGIMLVAKSEKALRALMAAFKERRIHKIYHALLVRCPKDNEGRIVAPLGRHPVERKKMAIDPERGRYAASTWQVLERYRNNWCFAEIGIETGRTHQIRVHMASLKAPVLGDCLYGGAVGKADTLKPARQMLHASSLLFQHPFSGQQFKFTAPFWPDMQTLLDVLRSDF